MQGTIHDDRHSSHKIGSIESDYRGSLQENDKYHPVDRFQELQAHGPSALRALRLLLLAFNPTGQSLNLGLRPINIHGRSRSHSHSLREPLFRREPCSSDEDLLITSQLARPSRHGCISMQLGNEGSEAEEATGAGVDGSRGTGEESIPDLLLSAASTFAELTVTRAQLSVTRKVRSAKKAADERIMQAQMAADNAIAKAKAAPGEAADALQRTAQETIDNTQRTVQEKIDTTQRTVQQTVDDTQRKVQETAAETQAKIEDAPRYYSEAAKAKFDEVTAKPKALFSKLNAKFQEKQGKQGSPAANQNQASQPESANEFEFQG